ncbi:MAG: hypothetical protein QXR47_04855 [Candidatus Caldarchaeum sp.]
MRRTDLIAAYRNRLSLSKNDENDAKILSMMGRDCFKEVTAEYVELMKLIDEYYKQLNLLKLVKQFKASAEVVNLFRKNKRRVACQIISMATNTISIYGPLCETLCLSDDSLYGKVALADLLLHVDFTAKLRSILCYVGLYKPNNGRYSHQMNQAIHSLAISYYRKHRVKAKEVRQLVRKIRNYVRAGGRPDSGEKAG